MAGSMDFPFTIMDVASLLRLNIRRRGGSRVVYTDCPLCGDKRGKMALYPQINTWHCYHCGEYGGMLPLYGQVYGIDNSAAYHEICEALGHNRTAPEYEIKAEPSQAESPERATDQEIHRTLTALLRLLPLRKAHWEHLRVQRGLTDEQIRQFGFRSTPLSHECRPIAHHLAEFGCTLKGVPGFYLDDKGRWTMKFFTRTSGIIIPIRGVEGLLRGLQIRLDHPIKNKDDPPEKKGTKYLPFTSTGKPMGVTSGNPIHFVGAPGSRVVYVTEGALKADIAHALTGRTFAATVGVNNTMGMDELFAFLRRNGTEEIIEAEDMDKYSNPNVSKGASKVHQLAAKNGLACRRLVWNPNHKGIDDWLLALRDKGTKEKEQVNMNFKEMYLTGQCPFDYIYTCIDLWSCRKEKAADIETHLGLSSREYQAFLSNDPKNSLKSLLDNQRHTQRYRVYQLCLESIETLPFAFRSMETMLKSGYQQPPASSYQLVYDGELIHPRSEAANHMLERIFARCNDDLPEGYQGHSLSMSDVVELCDGKTSAFYYCDTVGFTYVKFEADQAKPMREVDADV